MSDITKTDVRDSIRSAARGVDQAIAKAVELNAHEPVDLAVTDALWAARDQLTEALQWV